MARLSGERKKDTEERREMHRECQHSREMPHEMADMMREDIRLCRYDNIYDRLGRMIRTSEIATNKFHKI